MNALEQLREDVKEELDDFDAWSALQEGVLAILDRFISEWEVVEVCENKHCKGLWYFEEDAGFDPHHRKHIQTVLRRTQEPTLLEVMKRVEAVMDKVNSTDVADFMSARAALSEAISKEQSE